jgi:aspartyl-tRNA(Asn)/glutamyl-tRNA(Gln) amidotransferase subunit A
MSYQEIISQPALDLARLLEKRQLSAVQICEAFIARAAEAEPAIQAFLHLDAQRILSAAQESDRRRARGEASSPLDGIPVGIKDVIAIEGEPLTCASRMLETFVSPYTSTVGERLHAAGMIPFGRLNMDEFAMGSSTENSAFQVTRNPWNTAHTPGGSSGGSAAAVAALECPWSLGSDTGGSIRQPAAFCGVVGLKPTYGRVSRFGLAAFASSLDQIGPIGRCVADVAALLDIISGPDRRDSTCWPESLEAASVSLEIPPTPGTIGVPANYLSEGVDADVKEAVERAIHTYQSMGFTIREVSLPHTDLAVPTYYIIATAEASSNLARYDGVRYTRRTSELTDAVDLFSASRGEGFGTEVKRRIILGSYVLSSGYYDAYYKRAQQVRALIRNDFLAAFNEVDLILTPTTPTPAFKIGEKISDPLAMYLADIFTISVNLSGLPGVSLPCGLSSDGLPIGLQLIGQPFMEGALLKVAAAYEKAAPFTANPPAIQPA